MKRLAFLLLLTAAVAVVGARATWAQTWKAGPNVTATLSGGTFTVSGKGPMTNLHYDGCETDPEFNFPWCFGSVTKVVIGNGVTSIDKRPFYSFTKLTSVTISNSVTEIWNGNGYNGAFGACAAIKSMNIGSGLTGVEKLLSGGNFSNLTAINIDPNSANYSSIDGVLFNKDKNILLLYPKGRKGAYVIPDGVDSITKGAFFEHIGLTSITIPNSMTSISQRAFSGCTGLTSVNIPNSVTSIGKEAFSGCTGLTSINIPNSVTSIEQSAFSGCTGLTSITIPNSVTSIGDKAFSGCTGLTSVAIPNSVTSIRHSAFSGCTGLTSIDVDPNSAKYSSIDGVLFNKNKNILLLYPGSKKGTYIIPNGVDSIIGGFSFHTGLTSITIPNSMTSIRQMVFYGCTGLTSVTIPNSVTSIGEMAFYGCIGLTSVTIPNSVTSIGQQAFVGCTGLTSITIPNSVTSIGQIAFSGCTGLTSITIPNSVTSIGQSAFSGCTGLTSIAIPNSVTSIGYGTFSGCTGLTSVTIPSSVTSIGQWAFSGSTGLTSVTIPGSVTSIERMAFYGCTGLTSITTLNPTPLTLEGSFHSLNTAKVCLNVPPNRIDAYRAAAGWKDFSCIKEIELSAEERKQEEERKKEEGEKATVAKYASDNNNQAQALIKAGDNYVNTRNYKEAAEAYFRAGEIYYRTFEGIKLTAKNADEMGVAVRTKTKALEDPAKYFVKACALGADEWTVRATYMIGKGFYDMAEAVANQTLFGNEIEKMAGKIKVLSSLDKYYDKAIEYFGQNAAFAKKRNLKGEYVEKSMQAMMEMAFRKGDILEQTGLVFKNSPVPAELTGKDREAYVKLLEGRYLKALDGAKPVYENGMKIAKDNGIAKGKWIDRIRERLSAIKSIRG